MVEDYEVCRRPWGFEPSEVKAPVVLWHGLSDRLAPVRHALRLAAALPACAIRLEPRAGHGTTVWERPRPSERGSCRPRSFPGA
jgi:pimeloyl-ACP methyl ester carboxylesterase